ncbi:hypothetical protein DVS77_14295 [Mycolicibacterium moriokaense]|nr:hypothetical protein DVS77_14295 [Mycolicibacterium moriokaense]
MVRSPDTAGMRQIRVLAVIACLVCAVAAFGLSLMTSMDVWMFGFPDGHITDYQQAATAPLRIITWVEAGIGLLLLALAFSPIGTRVRTVAWGAALIALVTVAVAGRVGVPWYFGTRLGLDNGIGG